MKTQRIRPAVSALALLALLLPLAPARAQTFADQVTELVNQERWNNGQLAPLKRNALLDSAALTHSTNMAVREFFSHCDVDTHTLPWDRMTSAGYSPWSNAAENIAAGYSTPALVMSTWMGSSGHRANILSTALREIGVGYYLQNGDQNNIRYDSNSDCTVDGTNYGPYYHYWTQDFGTISAVYPVVINREAYQANVCTVNLYMYGSGWAQQMRFRNESGTWSDWMPYAADVAWTLSPGNGTKTVNAEIKNASGTVRTASDVIELGSNADVVLSMDAAPGSGTAPTDIVYTLHVVNNGPYGTTAVTVVNTLPSGLAFISATGGATEEDGVVTCPAGNLASGGSADFTITAHAAAGGTFDDTAVAQAGEYDPNPANNSASHQTTLEGDPTAVPDDNWTAGPAVAALRAGVPNPFRSTTTFAYRLPVSGEVRLSVFDAAGRHVRTLIEGSMDAGEHLAVWDGRGESGVPVATGLYFIRLDVPGAVRTQKVLLAR